MSISPETKPTEYAHIVRAPQMFSGEPFIKGHRIRVRDVVVARDVEEMSPAEIVHKVYPSLTLSEVYAALAYYEDHRGEIDQLGRDESEFVERFAREHPELVHDLRTTKDSV